MTVKLHLHSGFRVPRLGITPDTELGHLYSDKDNLQELHAAAAKVGMKRKWFQDQSDFPHYDLWKDPLRKAKGLFPIVTHNQFMDEFLPQIHVDELSETR